MSCFLFEERSHLLGCCGSGKGGVEDGDGLVEDGDGFSGDPRSTPPDQKQVYVGPDGRRYLIDLTRL